MKLPEFTVGSMVYVETNPYSNERDISPAVKYRVVTSASIKTNKGEFIYELEGLLEFRFLESELTKA